MGTGGQIFGLIIALVLVVGFFGMLAEAREQAEAEMADEDFDHNEGEEIYDEDIQSEGAAAKRFGAGGACRG